ncbi:hypothetical protein NLM31_29780 [Bradyrhizobium sp. CCGUVB4N]|uniref:hypothetical protein n=1 Tax=Bradyrhizobium sp. CCGUVB4N TaxID=2949631 RepID=UPI0020B241BF|nr:hypothetical protein [Bradyrhizobium sp. CCGUVB4N]MCP3384570.1 hypothetical protein [Bradyrhizobium sp. CCGUVB4N]
MIGRIQQDHRRWRPRRLIVRPPNVPQSSSHRERTGNLEAVKRAFLAALTDLQFQISYAQVREVRGDRRRSRPWHKC